MINSEIFYLFSIISVGYILGNIKIRGFSLDITAMLLVALIAGHFGMVISDNFKLFGLAIFIYAVGLQSGPGFFETIKNEGIKLNLLAIFLLLSIFTTIYILGTYFGLSKSIIDGIFTGSLTSVPSLAAAIEVKNDPIISVIFGVVYPFGIFATILFIRILPIIFRVNLDKEVENYEKQKKQKYPLIFTKNFKITNENFKLHPIKKSQVEKLTSTLIERIEAVDKCDLDDKNSQLLHFGDIIRVSGTKEQLETLAVMLGDDIGDAYKFHDDMKVLRLLVTSKNIVGKKIASIKELKSLRGVVTKVRRAGIDITPHPSLALMLGDKLYVVTPEKYSDRVTDIIGNNLLKYPAADFLPISLGIVFGIILGSIPFSLPFVGDIKLSFVGGILITALILGRLGRIGPVVWQLSPHSNTLMKTLGQLIFMAAIGTNAGKYLLQGLSQNGFLPIYIALFALIFSLFLVAFICRIFFKMNFLNILGLLSGGMTSTPTLTMANNITKSDYPSVSYAAVYPMALVVAIVLAQILLKLF
ncbi:MAG: YidE/YbjL duplication [Campylobacteraceae bacterium]|nr:YidE/YbjL duplication [Campylobacteraceae bacterium]